MKGKRLVLAGVCAVLMIGTLVFSNFTKRLPFESRAAAQTSLGFERIATFDVNGVVAEIVAATPDGKTLIYTNATDQRIGFVDITNPAKPVEVATLNVAGEPTSVAVTPDGQWALVVIDGSPDQLTIYRLSNRSLERTIPLGGQPDSIAISPDGQYAAIAIENERNESLNGGRMPQGPAGFLTIVDLDGEPAQWQTRNVSLLGLANRFPDDPEPEYVDINAANQAAVTLQENNHVVIVDLASGQVVTHFSAGTTTHTADTKRDNNIVFTDAITNAPREPDSIIWTPGNRLLTANEGDYSVDLASGQFIGGRDFTLFSAAGAVVFEPGASLELEAVKHGHYPDARSNSKGCEFEGAEVGVYAGVPLAFIGSERGNFVAVYRLDDETRPQFLQLLATGVSPEGLLAIPQRGLFVTANEVEGSLSIFALSAKRNYPTVVSDGLAWSALSGLAQGPGSTFYAVPDSAFRPSRIYTLKPGAFGQPTRIEAVLNLPGNFDLEGIAVNPGGGWWVVSEGAGNAGQTTATKNLLLKINPDGSIAQTVELPASVNAQQVQFGFEGVTTSSDGAQVYVAFQREWRDDPTGRVKIGRYTVATGEWAFYHYPIEAAQPGGWVGLSEIVRVNDTIFAVIERDNQLRENVRIKRLYTFSIAGLTPVPAGGTPPLVTKTLAHDLLVQNGILLEKAEGLLVNQFGDFVVAYDNDGVGETQLLTLLNPAYDICLQDELTGDVLRFNSRNGEYFFARCGMDAFTLKGRGSITGAGNTITLQSAQVGAQLELINFGQLRYGQAIIRKTPVGPYFVINDRDTANNTCICR